MEAIQNKVLALINKMGQGETKTVLVPMLDRHLVVVEKEREVIGSKLIAVIRELIAAGLLAQGEGLRVSLTEAGKRIATR